MAASVLKAELIKDCTYRSAVPVKRFASLDAGLLARKGDARPSLSQETKILADAGFFEMPPQTDPGPKLDQVKQSKDLTSIDPASRSEMNSKRVRSAANGRHQPQLARIAFGMQIPDFLRLKMAGVMLEKPCREIVHEAISQYLDQHNMRRFDACPCFHVEPNKKDS